MAPGVLLLRGRFTHEENPARERTMASYHAMRCIRFASTLPRSYVGGPFTTAWAKAACARKPPMKLLPHAVQSWDDSQEEAIREAALALVLSHHPCVVTVLGVHLTQVAAVVAGGRARRWPWPWHGCTAAQPHVAAAVLSGRRHRRRLQPCSHTKRRVLRPMMQRAVVLNQSPPLNEGCRWKHGRTWRWSRRLRPEATWAGKSRIAAFTAGRVAPARW